METFRFKHFSLTFEWWMILVLLFGVVLSADAIVTTCENIQTAAPWWHTAFTTVESVVFPAALVCLILLRHCNLSGLKENVSTSPLRSWLVLSSPCELLSHNTGSCLWKTIRIG